ncbi:sugar phosphate isomerase/epimerase family protein [Flexithrix dorotheae]|uniref:sugar phosphate isomerase/epimerase family protein n=1 Tax=Flexithrix dorotheae TaxID=70993 RepID=UPI00035EB12E|nr:sugar phosphate isomerase/epimerase [Flexithrix dorotheae]
MNHKNQSRRNFIKSGSALLGTALPLMSMSKPFEALVKNSKYYDTLGVQLYTVRNQLDKNFEGTIKAIKELGYSRLEAMDLEDQLPKLMPIAKDLGLKVNSSFFKWTYLTGRWDLVSPGGTSTPPKGKTVDHVIDLAEKNNLEYLVFGYLRPEERETLDDFRKIAKKLNETGEKCNKAGIKLCYHNHSFEFEKKGDATPFDILIEDLDPKMVQFELDIFWASLGGWDPEKTMKKLKNRIRLLHLKDKKAGAPVIYNEGEVPVDTFKELGNGTVDIKGVLALAEKIGVEQCYVEQDQSPDPIKSIGESINFMSKV